MRIATEIESPRWRVYICMYVRHENSIDNVPLAYVQSEREREREREKAREVDGSARVRKKGRGEEARAKRQRRGGKNPSEMQ